MRELRFTCQLPNGVHARPASALEEIGAGFDAEILLTNERTGRAANAKSVLALLGADIRYRDSCRLAITGPDEVAAAAALSAFLRDRFPHSDDELSNAAATTGIEAAPLPRALRDVGAAGVHRGTPVVGGIGQGRIVQAGGLRVPESLRAAVATEPAVEIQKIEAGLAALVESYLQELAQPAPRLELDLLKAHCAIARDPEFRARLIEAARQQNRTAAGAIADAETHFTEMLATSGSVLLRERALDIRDVCSQLLRHIYGEGAAMPEARLDSDSVVVAEAMTPGQLLHLERSRLKGLVLGQAAVTSHTVILARSFGIPTLVGVAGLPITRLTGQEAIVDGEAGLLVTELEEPVRHYYDSERRRLEGRSVRQRRFATQPGNTADGHRVEIACNIASAEEAVVAFSAGAESIGVFRTEMLFLNRAAAPSEEEQFETYCRALEAAGGRAVVFRTLDIGGDKPLPYLNLPAEDNPFLGYRAVRIYPEFEGLFRTQVRALLRASEHGHLELLIPMITNLDEARWVKQAVRDEQARLTAEREAPPLGAMIEVPAAAFLLDAMVREFDFFSIGSNDLLQYFTAADRTNPRLDQFHDWLQPAFLRLLKKIVDDVHAGGKAVGLCGEMAGQPSCLPLLVGLGFDDLSVAPSAVAAVKSELASWPLPSCRDQLRRALECASAAEVRRIMEDRSARDSVPLVEPELVVVDSASTTQAEAIKELVDLLYIAGRTERPRAVEEAVWEREGVYSTGFGHGFAMPHCKTNAVTANSAALLKLRAPLCWNSIDGEPVNTLLLLTIRECDQANVHMRIISRLARQIVHEDFRQRLAETNDPAALCALLLTVAEDA